MNSKDNYSTNTPTFRENFLMNLLSKIIKEYKALWDLHKEIKPFKIIEILALSIIPGETKFAIQIANKNCVLHLTAADIFKDGYSLNDFSLYHAEIIQQAAQGKLMEYFKLKENTPPKYKIISKKYNRDVSQYIFVIENNNQCKFVRTAAELAREKDILSNMDFDDIYNIGYTQGSESIIKEKIALQLLKTNNYL